MSFRINTPQIYLNSFSQKNDILDPSGFTIQNNIYNLGFRKSSYGQGKWIVISSSVSSSYTTPDGKFYAGVTSTDGINWSGLVSTPAFYSGGLDTSAGAYSRFVDILYANNTWVAVSQGGDLTRAISSPDGITWTKQDTSGGATGLTTATTAAPLNGIAYAQGQFVIVGGNSVANTNIQRLFTSPDGITWTGRTIYVEPALTAIDVSATRSIWQSAAYGNNTWVAVASNASSSTRRVIISTDGGVKWYNPIALTPAMNTKNWQRIIYANGIFVAVAADDATAISTDGINWTLNTSFTAGQASFYDIDFGNGIFIASTDQPGLIYKSSDGVNWTTVPSQVNNQLVYGISFGNNSWVANAQTGTDRIFKMNYINNYTTNLQWISPYKEIRLRNNV